MPLGSVNARSADRRSLRHLLQPRYAKARPPPEGEGRAGNSILVRHVGDGQGNCGAQGARVELVVAGDHLLISAEVLTTQRP